MYPWSIAVLLGAILAIGAMNPVLAAGNSDPFSSSNSGSSSGSRTNGIEQAQALVDDKDYRRAVTVLNEIVEKDPQNADAHNLLGFSHRKMENFARAERHYDIALQIDPAHKGALEYVGELYLQTGRRGEAEAMMARLEKACPSGCSQLDDLRAAFAGGGSKKSW